ncbi:MAG TPA: hypothetical protein VK395_37980 [Gemmataceae bacterium]|nr:hypothetical protein [Gemmataceae bacterium]
MAIHIQLPTEIEMLLKAKAAQRRQTLEEYLQEIASREARTGNGSTGLTQAELAPQDRATLWRTWASSHRSLPTVADDSRETIYAGRGE